MHEHDRMSFCVLWNLHAERGGRKEWAELFHTPKCETLSTADIACLFHSLFHISCMNFNELNRMHNDEIYVGCARNYIEFLGFSNAFVFCGLGWENGFCLSRTINLMHPIFFLLYILYRFFIHSASLLSRCPAGSCR